jgi:HK97 gp10 family phage protein
MTVKVLYDKTPQLLAALSGDRLGEAVVAGGFVLETAVKISMSAASHTGRQYGKHKASAPGETPAVDTGVLVNSIETQLASSSATDAWAEVGTGVEYAEFLEFGTSKMAARPFMRPGYDNNVAKIEATVRDFAKREIEQATK